MTKWLNDQGADMFLAVDTVFEQCSIAVVTEDLTVLSLDTHFGKREQTQQILPMIDAALKQAGVSLKDLTALIFNRGPGAFSGIRINTAVVQALSVAHDLPCVGVSSLQALAQTGFDNHGLPHVYAALDARMKQVYFGEFVNQSGIMSESCIYDSSAFKIDLTGQVCLNPNTGLPESMVEPNQGCPIIWLNFDAQPFAGSYSYQISTNDDIGWAVYYSATRTNGLNANGLSGDPTCSDLIFWACGGAFNNTFAEFTVPSFTEATNLYLAIWDTECDWRLHRLIWKLAVCRRNPMI